MGFAIVRSELLNISFLTDSCNHEKCWKSSLSQVGSTCIKCKIKKRPKLAYENCLLFQVRLTLFCRGGERRVVTLKSAKECICSSCSHQNNASQHSWESTLSEWRSTPAVPGGLHYSKLMACGSRQIKVFDNLKRG